MIACGQLQKTKKESKSLKNGKFTVYSQNEVYKACFQLDMAYMDFEDLTRRTASHKLLRDKAFNVAKNLKYDGYQRGHSSVVFKFFGKKVAGSGIKTENISNQYPSNLACKAKVSDSTREIAEKLHNQVIREFKKRKVHSTFIDNIWGADLADLQF